MKQQSLSASGFDKYKRATRKEQFLALMDKVIPWQELCALIEPHYPNPQGRGRRPVGIERMLRLYFLQHWYNLSDPGLEDALYDTPLFRQFVGIDLCEERAPDETTILRFRHLLETHDIGKQLFDNLLRYLEEHGVKVERGTMVDATILHAPSSTKNKDKKRDPDMHSTSKNRQWYFGMKAHVGVDSKTGLIHSLATTAANAHDSTQLENLLHGKEAKVWGDSAYSGKKDVMKAKAPKAQDLTHKKGKRNQPLSDEEKARNTTKSRIRAKVEHVFHVMKCQFGFRKVRYRGLAKNTHHLKVQCALINLVMATRQKAFIRAVAP